MKRVYQELVNLIDLGIFDEQDFVRFFFIFNATAREACGRSD